MDAAPLTIERAAEALAARELTSRGLVESCLARADELDGTLGTFVTRCDAAALAAADGADRLFAKGRVRSPLQGIPVGVKDVLTTVEMPTTGQSRAMPPEWVSRRDAASVARLREAGAVVVGKTTTMEFALGLPDAAAGFPVPRNPWDLDRWSGGSSSGTANGVAAGLFLGGLGTDTGGSIRLPSAFCGITGLKPSRGRVSLGGCVPLAPTLDHVGPMARSARDCAQLLAALTGRPAAPALDALAGASIAVEREHHVAVVGVDPGAVAAFEGAVEVLSALGARLTEVSLPGYEAIVAASQVVMLREAFELHRANLRRRWSDYGVHTRERLAHGAFLTADDEARARSVHRSAGAAIGELLARHSAIVCLTAGGAPERVDELGVDSHLAAAGLTFTRIWNALGEPAVSVPIGLTTNGVPVGMMVVGRLGEDEPLLALAEAFQTATSWHLARPPHVAATASSQAARRSPERLDTPG